MSPITLSRMRRSLTSDPSRVITRFYYPSGQEHAERVVQRVLSLNSEQQRQTIQLTLEEFAARHHNIERVLLTNFRKVANLHGLGGTIPPNAQLLIGAYFTHEYSVESTALFNPSIVPHPDQSNLPTGAIRFVMSLRAVGEGHISSIVFRSGTLHKDGPMIYDAVSPIAEIPIPEFDPYYDKHTFTLKLDEMRAHNKTSERIFAGLPDHFPSQDLIARLEEEKNRGEHTQAERETIETIETIAESNYTMTFRKDTDLAERVIFPVARGESSGIEDARFVRFVEESGEVRYLATYTAFDGHSIFPMLLETRDFMVFDMRTLNGKAAVGKDLALFPRKLNGNYCMISRQDGENLFIMHSNNLHFWHECEQIQVPKYSWEFMQIGNCGAPIETEQGWLLLTHGVGPMRKYSIGAVLLDIEEPSRVIRRLEEPLIVPNEYQREGYVPNVVYTCGAMVHGDNLIIPYSVSDTYTGVVTTKLNMLLDSMKQV